MAHSIVHVLVPKIYLAAVKKAVKSNHNGLNWTYQEYLEFFLREGISLELSELVEDN